MKLISSLLIMNKSIFVAILLFLSIHNQVHPVLTKGFVLVNRNNDFIYLLGDWHKFSLVDSDQTYAVCNFFENRETSETEHFMIYIEDPIRLHKDNGIRPTRTCSITECLVPTCLRYELKYTAFEEIEKRIMGMIIHTIFDGDEDTLFGLDDYYVYSKDGDKINIEGITFEDFCWEFKVLKKYIKKRQKEKPFISESYLEQHLKKAQDKYDEFLECLNENDIVINNNVLKVARTLYLAEEAEGLPKRSWMTKTRCKICDSICTALCYLFDLIIMERINSNSYKKKLVVAGYWHIEQIIPMLESQGYIVCKSTQPSLRQFELEPEKVLAIFNEKQPTVYAKILASIRLYLNNLQFYNLSNTLAK